MPEFLDCVRTESSKALWSQAVELVRSASVLLHKQEGGEWHLKVKDRSLAFVPTAVLWPEEEDWNCSCQGAEDPCAHVLAAAIALQRHARGDYEFKEAQVDLGRFLYEFYRTEQGLGFRRRTVCRTSRTAQRRPWPRALQATRQRRGALRALA